MSAFRPALGTPNCPGLLGGPPFLRELRSVTATFFFFFSFPCPSRGPFPITECCRVQFGDAAGKPVLARRKRQLKAYNDALLAARKAGAKPPKTPFYR